MRNQKMKKGKHCKELICILIDREKRIRKKYSNEKRKKERECVCEREKERKKDRKTERKIDVSLCVSERERGREEDKFFSSKK